MVKCRRTAWILSTVTKAKSSLYGRLCPLSACPSNEATGQRLRYASGQWTYRRVHPGKLSWCGGSRRERNGKSWPKISGQFLLEVQIYIIHYCVHTLLVFLLGCLFLLHGSIGLFHVAKIGGKEIGYLSDVAINAISLNKISYIPAQLFRASMKVLHSICNIFAFQMKKQMLADDRGD